MAEIEAFTSLVEEQQGMVDDPEKLWEHVQACASGEVDSQELTTIVVDEGRLIKSSLIRVQVAPDTRLRYSDGSGRSDRLITWSAMRLPDNLSRYSAEPNAHIFLDTQGGRWFGALSEAGSMQKGTKGRLLLNKNGVPGRNVGNYLPSAPELVLLNLARVAQTNAGLRNGLPLLDIAADQVTRAEQ